jgi:hypothetical protein
MKNLFGYIGLLAVLGFFTYQLLTQPQPWILIDALNLGIHEAGHLVFTPFGMFIYMLGGTIGQLSVPIAFAGYFGYTKRWDALLFCLWWIGENLVNISVYMRDAIAQELPLFGGGIHDWGWIFTELNLLDQSAMIADIVHLIALLFLFSSLFGFVGLIFVQFRKQGD